MLADGLVTGGGDDEDVGVAGAYLLDVAHHFLVDVRSGGDGDKRSVGVEQGNGAVLEFSGGKTFRVNVGDFLELERTLQGRGIADAAPDEHDTAHMRVVLRQWRDGVVGAVGLVQYLLNLRGNTLQCSQQLV